jgi:hypothetical protein
MRRRALGAALFTAGLMLSIGPVGRLVWAHHMFTVGVNFKSAAMPFVAAYLGACFAMAFGGGLIWWPVSKGHQTKHAARPIGEPRPVIPECEFASPRREDVR